jgi:formylglycine-generating enzyme required for sulfatase activity
MSRHDSALAQRIAAVLASPTDRLDHLVQATNLDPSTDLRYGDWRTFDLSGANLRGFNFLGADLTNARFDNAFIAGAIFDRAIYDLTSLRKAADFDEFMKQEIGRPAGSRPQLSDRRLKPFDVIRDAPACPELVVIPAGEFMMGSTKGEGGAAERPRHRVTIASAFVVSIFPVTREEFAAFISATNHEMANGAHVCRGQGWEHDPSKSWSDPSFQQEDNHPVVCVNWHDCQAYVAWLREQSGGKAYRLLSEAEWEYCCRAGAASAYGICDTVTVEQANFGQNFNGTTAVTKFLPNSWMLRDMCGNVWEWCEDNWHKDYKGNPPSDGAPWRSEHTSFCVLRGGSWFVDAKCLRSAYRARNQPDYRATDVGFRVGRTL